MFKVLADDWHVQTLPSQGQSANSLSGQAKMGQKGSSHNEKAQLADTLSAAHPAIPWVIGVEFADAACTHGRNLIIEQSSLTPQQISCEVWVHRGAAVDVFTLPNVTVRLAGSNPSYPRAKREFAQCPRFKPFLPKRKANSLSGQVQVHDPWKTDENRYGCWYHGGLPTQDKARIRSVSKVSKKEDRDDVLGKARIRPCAQVA
ncbi:uncharacterized protein LACBIDRAFT_335565 [Laccaria bicolor S238N-H82]|uniref:Predicted protein n=1 Tax=Laccaria bicolor (strain S238N-H82 / ATCC MYA-4686) TaxID=486041 RepID=B0E2N9_LACBS|nr:uncharacterized protein LACBIDRAFT_335565 [Laccaria bicolor S238N-H82]EDQ98878.1 predicted protein [Laccaria bicolor S238N-H82]|eukprot:XP_001890457.1 predicted protein [Laccaria bicolor S238N-H82]